MKFIKRVRVISVFCEPLGTNVASDLGLHCLHRPIPILRVIMICNFTQLSENVAQD